VQTGRRRNDCEEDAMKKTETTELITDKGERVIFLLLAIVAAVFLYLE
jgi:hypothetical protein